MSTSMNKIKFHLAKVFEADSIDDLLMMVNEFAEKLLDRTDYFPNVNIGSIDRYAGRENTIEYLSKDDIDPCFKLKDNDIDETALSEECESLLK